MAQHSPCHRICCIFCSMDLSLLFYLLPSRCLTRPRNRLYLSPSCSASFLCVFERTDFNDGLFRSHPYSHRSIPTLTTHQKIRCPPTTLDARNHDRLRGGMLNFSSK